MRIISSYKQGQSIAHLMNILNALTSDNEIERLDAVGDVAEIAYIIGGMEMMMDIRNMQFGKKQEYKNASIVFPEPRHIRRG